MSINPSEHPESGYEAPAVDHRTAVDATLVGFIGSDPVCAHLRPSGD